MLEGRDKIEGLGGLFLVICVDGVCEWQSGVWWPYRVGQVFMSCVRGFRRWHPLLRGCGSVNFFMLRPEGCDLVEDVVQLHRNCGGLNHGIGHVFASGVV